MVGRALFGLQTLFETSPLQAETAITLEGVRSMRFSAEPVVVRSKLNAAKVPSVEHKVAVSLSGWRAIILGSLE